MKQIARAIYIVGIICGWFSFYYVRDKNHVKYSKFLYYLSNFIFLVFFFCGASTMTYTVVDVKTMEMNKITFSVLLLQSLSSHFFVIILNILLRKIKFKTVKLVNHGIRFFNMSTKEFGYKFEYKILKIIIVKIISINFLLVLLRMLHDLKMSPFFSTHQIIIAGLMFGMMTLYIDVFNILEIILCNMLAQVNQQLSKVFSEFSDSERKLQRIFAFYQAISDFAEHFNKVLHKNISLLLLNSLFTVFFQIYLASNMLLVGLDFYAANTLIFYRIIANVLFEFLNFSIFCVLNQYTHNEVSKC
jgi:7tm Chemosensory receptor